jgi:hypothetical protein
MELLLNILWLLIALGALGVWRLSWKRQERRLRSKPLQEWTAFVCALVFVFFAVSLSDDLHAEAILADDCARGRHHALVWNCGHALQQTAVSVHASPAVLPHVSRSAPVRVFARILPADFMFATAGHTGLFGSRAPPVLYS